MADTPSRLVAIRTSRASDSLIDAMWSLPSCLGARLHAHALTEPKWSSSQRLGRHRAGCSVMADGFEDRPATTRTVNTNAQSMYSAIKSSEDSPTQRKRLSTQGRRAQVLRTAATQCSMTGMRATTTAALAKAAGVPEPVLYEYFESKERLFREAVEHTQRERIRSLEARLASMQAGTVAECIERMAESTVMACVSGPATAALTGWALLEAPEYAIDLHRQKIGSISLMWQRRLGHGFRGVQPQTHRVFQHIPPLVHGCLAYGLWLAAIWHTEETAAPLAREFAAFAAQAACATMSCLCSDQLGSSLLR